MLAINDEQRKNPEIGFREFQRVSASRSPAALLRKRAARRFAMFSGEPLPRTLPARTKLRAAAYALLLSPLAIRRFIAGKCSASVLLYPTLFRAGPRLRLRFRRDARSCGLACFLLAIFGEISAGNRFSST